MSAALLLLLSFAAAPTPVGTDWLTLDEAKKQCEVTFNDDDSYIQSLIDAARAHIEGITGQALAARSQAFSFAAFARVMQLPVAPVRAINAVGYISAEDIDVLVPPVEYRLGARHGTPAVMVRSGGQWPVDVADYPDVVTVTAEVGPLSRAEIDEDLRHAGKMLVAHWYRSREMAVIGAAASDLPEGFHALLAKHRLGWIA
jgi:uncharacterized phiE125 gp8 family phage protein